MLVRDAGLVFQLQQMIPKPYTGVHVRLVFLLALVLERERRDNKTFHPSCIIARIRAVVSRTAVPIK